MNLAGHSSTKYDSIHGNSHLPYVRCRPVYRGTNRVARLVRDRRRELRLIASRAAELTGVTV